MDAHEVEFVGGPLDGHRYSFTHSPDYLPPLARLAMSADVVRVLIGQKKKATAPTTSLAVYGLDGEGNELRYYHIASITVGERQLDNV